MNYKDIEKQCFDMFFVDGQFYYADIVFFDKFETQLYHKFGNRNGYRLEMQLKPSIIKCICEKFNEL